MVDLKEARHDPEKQLFEQLERVHAGMLGVAGSRDHMQPMGHRADPERKRLYFYTKTDTDLVRQVGNSAEAHFCIIGKDQDYHACIMGTLTPTRSREIIDRYWGPVVAAWYEKGKDDPQLIVLEFTPIDAAIWASTGSSLRFGWEIAKANMTEAEPDVGVRTEVRFQGMHGSA